jgi:hypothetical protein
MGNASSDQPWALAIECSNPTSVEGEPRAFVAGCLLDGGRAPGDPWRPRGEAIEIGFEPGSRDRDGLLPAVEALRVRLDVAPGGLARVGVSAGPGGYTGLRVGASAGMLLADATGAELVGVPSSWVAAHEAGLDHPFVVCLASKRGMAYAVRFESSAAAFSGQEMGLIDGSGFKGLGVGAIVADRHLPSSMRLRANDLGLMMVPLRLSATACLSLCLGAPPESGGLLLPRYAREPEAVRLWRARDA